MPLGVTSSYPRPFNCLSFPSFSNIYQLCDMQQEAPHHDNFWQPLGPQSVLRGKRLRNLKSIKRQLCPISHIWLPYMDVSDLGPQGCLDRHSYLPCQLEL